jgi:hypothetical protein
MRRGYRRVEKSVISWGTRLSTIQRICLSPGMSSRRAGCCVNSTWVRRFVG